MYSFILGTVLQKKNVEGYLLNKKDTFNRKQLKNHVKATYKQIHGGII